MALLERWAIAGGKVAGRLHDRTGAPCQDFTAHAYRQGVMAVALSDGAGSCKLSNEGARVLTRTVCALMTQRFDEFYVMDFNQTREELTNHLVSNLERYAADRCQLRDLSATLAFVACKEDRWIAGHVGDGAIVVLGSKGLFILSEPERGEFANQTYFLNSKEAEAHLRIYRGCDEPISGVALMSDGSCECLIDRREDRCAPAIRQMLDGFLSHSVGAVTEALQADLNEVIRNRTQDDCSLILARKRSMEPSELLALPLTRQLDFYFDRQPAFVNRHLEFISKWVRDELTKADRVPFRRHSDFLKTYINPKPGHFSWGNSGGG